MISKTYFIWDVRRFFEVESTTQLDKAGLGCSDGFECTLLLVLRTSEARA